MKYGRVYNFSAGPATMPEPVLEEIRDEMMNYRGSGMCVMEMSHRSKGLSADHRRGGAGTCGTLMNIPDNYKVLFIQGGATLQFAMVPMNLMKNGVACYVETGAWSRRPSPRRRSTANVHVVASSKDRNYSYIPNCDRSGHPRERPTMCTSVRTRPSRRDLAQAAQHQGPRSGQ